MSDLLAIIGGTGLDLRATLGETRDEIVETRWGTAFVTHAMYEGRPLVFLHRHTPAPRSYLPPHRVNYRANIAALKQLGATAIFASFATGSLRPTWPPGTLVLLNDFADFTPGRATTFFDDRAVHADMTEPFCPRLRALLRETAADLNLPLEDGGTYVCANGPRFETPAEIRFYARVGDVIGMTGCPEIALAREANIAYAGIAIATNFAAGLLPQPLTQLEVVEAMKAALPRVREVFLAAALDYRDDAAAPSRRVTEEYGFPSVV
ncbi:MAG TPA: MTAP family purine nucleoside phosphorylase [Abditibacteriaceae bacterium]